jgi:hypothetical protein
MLLIMAAIATSLLISETGPGIFAWLVTFFVFLGLLYEERWSFDPVIKRVSYTCGIFPFLKRTDYSFDRLQKISIKVIARDAVPGGEEEKASVNAVLEDMNGPYDKKADQKRRKALIRLIIDTSDGESLLIDTTSARRIASLKRLAAAISEISGVMIE